MKEVTVVQPNPAWILLKIWVDHLFDSVKEMPSARRGCIVESILLTLSPYLAEDYRHKPKMPILVEDADIFEKDP